MYISFIHWGFFLVYIYFVLWVIIPHLVILFSCSNSSFGLWELFQLALVWLDLRLPFNFFFSTSLLSGPTSYSRIILYFPCPNPRISHISMKLWFHLLKNRILKARSGCCMCILIATGILLLPANRTRSYMCIFQGMLCCA